MLTFLLKIRRSLIESLTIRQVGDSVRTPFSPTCRYLLHATGEILLVLVGILLAFQINNWNQYRQERKLEQSTLGEILESLDADIDLLQNQINTQNHNWHQIKALLHYLEENPTYTDSLDELIMFPIKSNIVSLNSSAFELLER